MAVRRESQREIVEVLLEHQVAYFGKVLNKVISNIFGR